MAAVESYNKHFEVPHLLSPVFTGQDEICRSLDSSLALSPPSRESMQRRFVLYGLGGSGKTQICVRYAQVHREQYVHHTSDTFYDCGFLLTYLGNQILGSVLD